MYGLSILLRAGLIIIFGALSTLGDVPDIAVVADPVVPECAVAELASSVYQIILVCALATAQVLQLSASLHHAGITS